MEQTKQEAKVEWVGPDTARLWLSRNTHNRDIKQARVNVLVDAIRSGEWELNGDAIRFDIDGTMVDGQHRCLAVLSCGIAIQTWVVRGLSRQAQETIDIGAKRTVADMLELRHVSNASAVAATAGLARRYDHGHVAKFQACTPQQIFSYLERHHDLLVEGVKQGKNVRNATGLNPTVAGAAFVIFGRLDVLAARDFFDKLRQGAALEANDPVLVLRNRLIREASQSRKMQTAQWLAIVIKTWNVTRGAKAVQVLHYRSDEPYPKAI